MRRRKLLCDSKCRHADKFGSWPHATKLDEDAGRIHTDDCGFFSPQATRSNRDPGDFCTAGWPGSACRVFSRAADLPLRANAGKGGG